MTTMRILKLPWGVNNCGFQTKASNTNDLLGLLQIQADRRSPRRYTLPQPGYLDSFTVSMHSPNGRHLPVISTVQGDCHWPLQNTSQASLQMHCSTRQSQSIFRPTNHRLVMPAKSHTPLTALTPPGQDCGRVYQIPQHGPLHTNPIMPQSQLATRPFSFQMALLF